MEHTLGALVFQRITHDFKTDIIPRTALLWVPVTVHREQSMKREKKNQHDATIRCLLSTSVSTCFGHHYAQLQENKDRVLLHMVYCAVSAGCGW